MQIIAPQILTFGTDSAFLSAISPVIEKNGFRLQSIQTMDELKHEAEGSAVLMLDQSVFITSKPLLTELCERLPHLLLVLFAQELSIAQWQDALGLNIKRVFLKADLVLAEFDQYLKHLYECSQRLQSKKLQLEHLDKTNQKLQGQLDLLRKDLQAGHYIQEKLQPRSPLKIGKLTFEHKVIPSLFLSGDFVDYMPVGEGYAFFCIADVAGHGASSAFITVLIKHVLAQLKAEVLKTLDYSAFEPDRALLRLNDEMIKLNVGKHVTLIVGLIDFKEAQLRYCLAGHLPPPILSSGGQSKYLLGSGPPIGLFAAPNYLVKSYDLPLVWSISCFSDGVFELLNASSLRECETELLERCHNDVQTLNGLQEELAIPKLSQVIDDVTVLNIRNF